MKNVLSKSQQQMSLIHLSTAIGSKILLLETLPDAKEEHFDLPTLQRMFSIKKDDEGNLRIMEKVEKPPVLPNRGTAKNKQSSPAPPE